MMMLLLSAAFFAVPVGAAQYFYTVDFDGSLNEPGQPPATGAGQTTPTSIVFGDPTVVPAFGHLTDQPLLFSAIGYQQIRFDLARGVPDYSLDFDFETRNLNPSDYLFKVLFDTPGVQSFYLHGLGYIGLPNSPALPAWSDGDLHHMHIAIDLPAHSWSFQLDNDLPVTGPFLSDLDDILSVRMNLSGWKASAPDDPSVQVAVDNIFIGTSVPEPSAVLLCAFGGLLLRLRGRVDADGETRG